MRSKAPLQDPSPIIPDVVAAADEASPFFTLQAADDASPFFTLLATDGAARAGTVRTAHGDIQTPIFMPVGTQGAVKALEHRSLEELDAQIILGNTYHLYLRPGTEVLRNMGGLHRFMNWKRPILTDSGGYQVFSLRELRTMNEQGVTFRSHIDGSKHLFTPENVVDMQRAIGSDITMVLDECTPYPVDHSVARLSMEQTVRWARRAQDRHLAVPPYYGHKQSHFGIVQGSVFADLRRECAKQLVDMDFDGYAIGGLAVGEEAQLMYEMIEHTEPLLPHNKPRYLMGVGTPENILRAIERGVDMFDCVMPTRNARNGTLFTTLGKVNIKNARWKNEEGPVDPGLDAWASQNVSMAYLRHLFHAGEILGLMFATMQNVALYLWLIRSARHHIISGTFASWSRETIDQLNAVRS